MNGARKPGRDEDRGEHEPILALHEVEIKNGLPIRTWDGRPSYNASMPCYSIRRATVADEPVIARRRRTPIEPGLGPSADPAPHDPLRTVGDFVGGQHLKPC